MRYQRLMAIQRAGSPGPTRRRLRLSLSPAFEIGAPRSGAPGSRGVRTLLAASPDALIEAAVPALPGEKFRRLESRRLTYVPGAAAVVRRPRDCARSADRGSTRRSMAA